MVLKLYVMWVSSAGGMGDGVRSVKYQVWGSKELKRGRGRGTTFLGEYTHTLELLPLFVYILWDR